VIVSNHGGRQVDGAIASLDALAPIVDAVGGQLAVLADSGIRSGSDAQGQAGVETVLKMLLAELDLSMALSGLTSVDQVDRSLLADQ
jgi:isopentenyl diphosphate isomerase/L-lactate dehydrogenase-like FMN-dependent dehydrogenase